MYKTLCAGAIGVTANSLEESVSAAKIGNFTGVELDINEIADRLENESLDDLLGILGDIRPAAFNVPVDWREDQATFDESIKGLPRLASAAAAMGCTRTMTYILSFSDTLDYTSNRLLHVDRFSAMAKILADYGCSIGLEFIGPKTMRDGKAHEFIHTMHDMLDMCDDIGPNAGLLLDCWHWYTSGSTIDELKKLSPEQVVYVHVNDAPAGIEIDEQIDNIRCLPAETGVIDIAGFLKTLQDIGYNGPVTPEPFKNEIYELPSDDERLKIVGASMDTIFAMIN